MWLGTNGPTDDQLDRPVAEHLIRQVVQIARTGAYNVSATA